MMKTIETGCLPLSSLIPRSLIASYLLRVCCPWSTSFVSKWWRIRGGNCLKTIGQRSGSAWPTEDLTSCIFVNMDPPFISTHNWLLKINASWNLMCGEKWAVVTVNRNPYENHITANSHQFQDHQVNGCGRVSLKSKGYLKISMHEKYTFSISDIACCLNQYLYRNFIRL